ncbi:MAG: PBP1A family penicillin-binding protein, partial [Pseudomonadota bacterium]
AVAALILAGTTAYFYSTLPSSDALFDGRGGGSVTMLDRNGNVFAWRGEQYGGDLRASEVSPHLIHAIVATEDRRFWRHLGLDPIGLARAMVANFRAGRIVQGGSTLTQQTAKNVFLSSERSIERKLKEVPMALALELKYTKEEILSIYLNRVYLGAGSYGFEAASQRYFGKSARLLSPSEAAMLAGLLRAPSRYSPTADLALAQGRAGVIIRLMEREGYLTESQVVDALTNPAQLSQAAAARAGGYFADWVMETAPAFLATETTEDVTIATTFDPRLQRAAEEAVASVFAEKVRKGSVAQAAVVVMSYDGAVRAVVGGRDRGVGQFNRASQALRQTGSAFKAVVYAAGLEAGMHPGDVFDDSPVSVEGWSPANYTRRFRGTVTMEEAFARSINSVAVRVSESAGRERVRTLAREMGFESAIAPGPAIALGTSEATPVEMAGVFASIANGGHRAPAYGIRSLVVRGDDLPLIVDDGGGGRRVLTKRTAARLRGMLEAVVSYGTGKRAALPDWPVAGKTGTTQAARDAWFVGFTPDFVAAVWMGNDDNTPLVGVSGSGLPSDIWRETMIRVHADLEPRPFPEIVPEPDLAQPPLVAIAPSRPREEADVADAGIVEQVFRDVLGGLLGGGGGSEPRASSQEPRPTFRPFGAGDR